VIRRLCRRERAVIDNLAGRIYLIVYADPGEADAYRNAQERLQQLRRRARPSRFPTRRRRRSRAKRRGRDAYEAAVRRAKDYIAAGDVMQVVLSQRMQLPFSASPLSLYRALRSLNPSPYMFYYDFWRFPRRRCVAGNPRAQGGVDGDAAPDCRNATARCDAMPTSGSRASSPAIRRRSPST
jgi:anthranilate synthase component 1